MMRYFWVEDGVGKMYRSKKGIFAGWQQEDD